MHGEAKRALQVFSTNKGGYTMALKTIKRMFSQISRISQAYIAKLTRGKLISMITINQGYNSTVQ